MKTLKAKSLFFLIMGCFLFGLFTGGRQEAAAKPKAKPKAKVYTELMLDYKIVKIRVPDKDFLTDGINYSLHAKSDKDRWAVQTTVITDQEDAVNPDFLTADNFSKTKPIRIGKKYYMDFKLKGLSYEVTATFTEKHKKFFEALTEKDFLIEEEKSTEFYKERIRNLYTFGASKAYIERKVLQEQDLSSYETSGKIEKAKETVKKYQLNKPFEKKNGLSVKRQKRGLIFAEQHNGENLDLSLARQIALYSAAGYSIKEVEKGEEIYLITFEKKDKKCSLLLSYSKEKKDKKTKKPVEGTDITTVFVLKKPL